MRDDLTGIVDALRRRKSSHDQPLTVRYAAERLCALETLIGHLERELPQLISEMLHEAAVAAGGEAAMLLEIQNSTLFIAYSSDPSMLEQSVPWVRAVPDVHNGLPDVTLPARSLEALGLNDAMAQELTVGARHWLLVVGTTSGAIDRDAYDVEAPILGRLFGALLHKHDDIASHEANVDHLTDLPDRWATMRRISEAAAHSTRNGTQAAVLFIDVNNFKSVNDTHGHAEGDKVLRHIATRMRAALRAQEFVGRIGGDEFAVVLSPIGSALEAENAARRLHASAQEAALEDYDISLGIGIAMYPDHAGNADDWLHCADMAMYRAKRSRLPYCLFDPQYERDRPPAITSPVSGERQYEQQFLVCFQPIFDVATGRVMAAEALVRLLHPKDGVLSAASALDALGTNQLALDMWVARKALAYADEWKRHGIERVHVNLSQYGEAAYHALMECVSSRALDPSRLAFELPPSSMSDREEVVRFIEGVNATGGSVGIDDFASGPVDLAAMERTGLSFVKLSRQLLPSAGLSGKSLEAVVAVSRIMGYDVIATRVSTSDDRRAIRAAGVKGMQGFAYAQPMTAIDFHQWVESSPAVLVG